MRPHVPILTAWSLALALLAAGFPAAAPAAPTAPPDGTTCFSPDGGCADLLTGFLGSARASVDMAIYDLTLDRVARRLAALRAKGVSVRVLVDRREARWDRYSRVPRLVEAGVEVRTVDLRGIMHDKFCVVDGREVETGSFNYTRSADRRNAENQVYLTSPSVVAAFRREFRRLWSRARPLR